ncbi:HK97 family phage prohead protease [Sphingomonas sp.]|uniref:HK97 family phage prohead protease n=1 Tax=Sphingomonas sp. TaxID=28214 RepID=UPI003CC6BC03
MTRFGGYAALFDRVDRSGDVFRAGAFAGAVSVPLLRNHRGAPIGGVTVCEDERGLLVAGFLAEDVDGVRVGDGLSVGFRATATRQGARREILGVRLVEVSLVAVPMQPGARVTMVSN